LRSRLHLTGSHMLSKIQTFRPRRVSDETKGNLAIVFTAFAVAVASALALWMVH
jgi:hypothetical protein